MDEEFNALFNELTDSECDMAGEDYDNFDVEKCSSMPAISSDMVDRRVSSVKACVTEYLRKECGDLNEMASFNDDKDDHDDEDDDDDASSKDVEVIEIATGEALAMPDRFVNLKDLSKEERNSLVAKKDKLEKIRALDKKQSHVNDYFMLE